MKKLSITLAVFLLVAVAIWAFSKKKYQHNCAGDPIQVIQIEAKGLIENRAGQTIPREMGECGYAVTYPCIPGWQFYAECGRYYVGQILDTVLVVDGFGGGK